MGAEKRSEDYKKILIEPHIQKIAGLMLIELYSTNGPLNVLVDAGTDIYGSSKKIWINDRQNPNWYRDLLAEFSIDRKFKNQPRWSSRKSRLNSSALNRTKIKQILRGFLRGYSYSRFAPAIIKYAEER